MAVEPEQQPAPGSAGEALSGRVAVRAPTRGVSEGREYELGSPIWDERLRRRTTVAAECVAPSPRP